MDTANWPPVIFSGALCTRAGQMTQRIFETVLAGCLDLLDIFRLSHQIAVIDHITRRLSR